MGASINTFVNFGNDSKRLNQKREAFGLPFCYAMNGIHATHWRGVR